MLSWQNSFHTYCTYFRILVNPIYHFSNIAEQLLSKIEDLKTRNVPLQTSVYETAASLISTYKENGFKVIRRTYSPTLKVRSEERRVGKECRCRRSTDELSMVEKLCESR